MPFDSSLKIVAKALLFDDDDNVLVLQRSPTHPDFPGHLDFPGGEVEIGEEGAQAVAREIKEETKLDFEADALRLVYEKQVSDSLIHVVYEGRLKNTKPNVRVSWEHLSAAWMTMRQLQGRPIPHGADGYYLTVLEYAATN